MTEIKELDDLDFELDEALDADFRQWDMEKQVAANKIDLVDTKGINLHHNSSVLSHSHLMALPKEILQRVFSYLSPADLTSCELCSKSFSLLANDNALWNLLYYTRWGPPLKSRPGLRWKVQYIDRDREEIEQTMVQVHEEIAPMYLEMQRAKRQRCIVRTTLDERLLVSGGTTISSWHAAESWRAAHGFTSPSEARDRPDLGPITRSKKRAGPSNSPSTFIEFGDVYVCVETGWVHLCDETCSEKVASDNTLVCRVSGRVLEHLVSECDDRCHQEQEVEENDFDFGGRLARAYMMGYECADETELEVVCGVVLD